MPNAAAKHRLIIIDFLRGMIILLMAIDHTREMFSSIAIGNYLGTQLSTGYYLTRWITHCCAPTFLFLSGLSIALRQERHQLSTPALSNLILKRGLFLILLSLTLVNLLWGIILNSKGTAIYLTELSVIGFGMLWLSLAVYLKPIINTLISLAIIFGHPALGAYLDHQPSLLWALLHVPFKTALFNDHVTLYGLFPLLPWASIAGIGYAFGELFQANYPIERRINTLRTTAAASLLTASLLRITGWYGEPNPFLFNAESYKQSIFSFLDVSKFPPSLIYTLMMLSMALFILSCEKHITGRQRIERIIITFGKAPLLFYVLHLAVIILLNVLLSWVMHSPAQRAFYSLWVIYSIYLCVLAVCYPIVKAFPAFKQRHQNRHRWLRYW